MNKRATLTSKGQITIPKEVRRHLGLEKGDQVMFSIEDGRTILHPVPTTHQAFSTYAGALGGLATAEEVGRWLRELRDED
ncbi:hypothetical protein BH23DEI1_BH23DEI1_24350 [soil metagenome]